MLDREPIFVSYPSRNEHSQLQYSTRATEEAQESYHGDSSTAPAGSLNREELRGKASASVDDDGVAGVSRLESILGLSSSLCEGCGEATATLEGLLEPSSLLVLLS